MLENLKKTQGLFNSQRILLKLIEKGLTREDAYRIVQNSAMISWKEGKEFIQLLTDDEKIMKKISLKEINEIFYVHFHIRNIEGIFKKVLKK